MDGIHDVGGKQGFGRIKVTTEDPPFPTEWEARAFGIAKATTTASDYSVDKFRYTREQLPPLEYLTAPYFEQWMRSTMAMLVGSGLVTAEELANGHTDGTQKLDINPPKSAEDARAAIAVSARFDGPYDGEPAFACGDQIYVSPDAPSGHTRLPQYVRGRMGHVLAYQGAHSVPEDNVRNIKTYEPLYTVAFAIGDLFEERKGSPDQINVEIWERFLAPAE